MKLGKGFLAFRKGGMLCVDTDVVQYTDYQDSPKKMELRTDPFPKGISSYLWIK